MARDRRGPRVADVGEARTRYFQIGFNRCGTRSLFRFFRDNGFAAVHHDAGRLAIAMDANLRASRQVLAGYEGCEAFFDMSFLRAHVMLRCTSAGSASWSMSRTRGSS